MPKTAVVLGASGLVGSSTVEELIRSELYSEIRLPVRQKSAYKSPIIKEYVVDFKSIASWDFFSGADEMYSCLGTTIKKAGSVEIMEQIDCDLVVKTAQIAYDKGVKNFAVVSSLGADENSTNYYLRIKGEMEKKIQEIPFQKLAIVRPSLLFGKRTEFRFFESLGKILARLFGMILFGKLKKYRGIEASKVAKAMIYILYHDFKQKIFLSDQLHKLGHLKK